MAAVSRGLGAPSTTSSDYSDLHLNWNCIYFSDALNNYYLYYQWKHCYYFYFKFVAVGVELGGGDSTLSG